MALQNRVTPFGEIVADPVRGTLMGNRGILHDDERRLGRARWRHPHWICCRLDFRGRKRAVMTPGRYTELFFLDEATALAAGHRPCFECRRGDFLRFREAWRRAFGADTDASAACIDRALHATRVDSRTRRQIRFEARLDDLPNGTFVALPDAPASALLVLGEQLLPWRADGYGPRRPRPAGRGVVLTPKPLVAVLRAGYAPSVHASADPDVRSRRTGRGQGAAESRSENLRAGGPRGRARTGENR